MTADTDSKLDVQAAIDALESVAWEPGVAKPDPILVADGVKRSFGGLVAVDVEHLEVQRGVITALIGPNGAGKTTFFNLMTNFDKPDTGTQTFNGEDLTRMPAHKVANRGMVRTFQLTKALSRMTVIENMKLGAVGQHGERFWQALLPFLWRRQESEIESRADGLLDRFKLAHMREEFAGTLSGGQRKLLEMARALMVEPELVMLDEPMAGVNPALKHSLLDHVTRLRDEGMTVLFVEHDMDMVNEISDWVVVMAEGRIIAEGPPASIGENQAVVDAYLGAHHDAPLDWSDEGEDEAASADEASAALADDTAPADDAKDNEDEAEADASDAAPAAETEDPPVEASDDAGGSGDDSDDLDPAATIDAIDDAGDEGEDTTP